MFALVGSRSYFLWAKSFTGGLPMSTGFIKARRGNNKVSSGVFLMHVGGLDQSPHLAL